MPGLPGHMTVRALLVEGGLADFATLKFTAQDYTMSRKSTVPARKAAGAGFHIEQLESRCMFAGDGCIPEPPVTGQQTGDGIPALVLHDMPMPTNTLSKPMVNAGSDATANVGGAFQLAGEVIVNKNVDLSVEWTLISGPGSATFGDATKLNSTVQFDQAGTYELEITATNDGITVSDRMLVTVTAGPALPIQPELFDTTYSLPTGGTTHYVNAGGNFQAALDAAQLGDVIVLEAGATFTGNFVLPEKTGEGWIYIISSKLDQLPEGERVGLEHSHLMPKLVAGNSQLPVLRTNFAAHHYRIAGVEVATNAAMLDLIRTGYGVDPGESVWDIRKAQGDEELPHHITFDRMLIHSSSDTNRLRHGIMLNGEYMAVIDSYIANVKDTSDAQAIWTFLGDGPFKVVNNFLEATGENMLVGALGGWEGNIPSDFEIRGNHFFKRTAWLDPDLWGVKNLFEIKNGQRFHITGNVFENNWTDAQVGFAILFTVRNQNGGAEWSVVQDINFENNLIKNVASAFNITGEDDLHPSEQTKRIRISNNLLENATWEYGRPVFLQTGTPNRPILDLTVTDNTFLSAPDENGPYGDVNFSSNRLNVDGMLLRDNLWVHGSYSVNNDRVNNLTNENNVIVMIPGNPRYSANKSIFNGTHPNNFMADPGFGSVGFVDFLNGDFRLAAGSPYKNSASDGTDPGADMGKLLEAISTVATPQGMRPPLNPEVIDDAIDGMPRGRVEPRGSLIPPTDSIDTHGGEPEVGVPPLPLEVKARESAFIAPSLSQSLNRGQGESDATAYESEGKYERLLDELFAWLDTVASNKSDT